MKKDLKTRLVNRKIKNPNPFLMTIFMWVLGILNRKYKVKFSYDYDPKAIKNQPTILLSSHASRLEFIYTIYGFKRKDVNIVCGYQNILKKGIYNLFIKLGVISKYLYQPDFLCVKNMIRVLKRNGAIGLFPEGIQSTSGSIHPINPATVQFIKSSKANIVVCSSKGAYLATNRYSKDRKKGYIGVNYSLLFTPKTLENYTNEQIYQLLLEKISYNDFAFNKVARNKYIGKKPNAFGLDKILYKCPNCEKEHVLRVENDTILCDSCSFKARVNEYYDLIGVDGKCPSDIDEWFKWQRRCVVNQVKSDDFNMVLSGSLCTVKLDKLRKSPKDRKVLSVGSARLTKSGLSFIGTLNAEKVDFNFEAEAVYSMTFSTQGFLEFYYKNDYFILVPDNYEGCLIKWTLATEEIHNLYDEKWKSACNDVYEYQKGEVYE
ncbi:MAG: hypothetical protein E7373_02170 [Clostridiales bacterium]|nr:hypothetical protein [Clostridiales bacterium]